jgi:NAD-dependent dihydropyrimidine dehydrogenase PreA subunit
MTYLRNVTTLSYQRSLCIGCGKCLEVCPQGVFEMNRGKAVLIERDKCMECGACMLNCPSGALEVEKGVGCALAVVYSKLKGLDEITCDCGGSSDKRGASPAGCCGQ